MNIAQLSEQLKDVPQNRLIDYARNPNSVVPQFLALAEIQRRQHLQAQAAPAPATVAEDVLGQANPQITPEMMAQQLPENQPGVVQLPTGMPRGMASGGIVAFADGGDIEEDDDEIYDPDEARMRRDEGIMMSLISRMKAKAGDVAAAVPRAIQDIKAALPESYEKAKKSVSEAASSASDEVEDFLSKIKHLESRGRHFDAKGNILTSPKGAEGIMQVMRKTQRDPGFGVTPARDRSPEELERVGRDYGIAMLREFGDPKLAAMAYNWGPANVKKWLASGQKTAIPEETRKYASNFAEGGIASYAGDKGSLVSRDDEDEDYETDYLRRSRGLTSGVRSVYDAFTTPRNYDLYDMYQTYIGKPFARGVDRFVNEPLEEQAAKFRSYSRNPNPTVGYKTPAGANAPAPKSTVEAPSPYGPSEDERLHARYPSPIVRTPFVPSTEDYDIGFGPNKYTPDSKSAEEKPMSLEDQILARNLEDREALKKQAETDKYLAMLQASLGMMAGTSPYALANIGQGGMQGVAAYAAAKKQRAAELAQLGKEEREILSGKRIDLLRRDAMAQEEALKRAGLSQREVEAAEKKIQSARDDYRQYKTEFEKDLLKKYPKVAMGIPDPKYDAEVAAFLNSPEMIGLRKLAFPNLNVSAPPAGSTGKIKVYNPKTGKAE